MLGYLSVMISYGAWAGVIGSFFADAFKPAIRYTGVAVGYGAGSVLASLAPIAATALTQGASWLPVALALTATAVISVIGAATLPQLARGSDSNRDNEAPTAT
uniref:Major facilitator superfamily (MFS) profile domain-containing protein n=1 Tax=Rhodococcus sp. NS1 TaxID=402236 RepID=A0A097SPW8_9NOCA|nr:hypothetical protein LRS1606.136 [Rhodococcus sp. NS1]